VSPVFSKHFSQHSARRAATAGSSESDACVDAKQSALFGIYADTVNVGVSKDKFKNSSYLPQL
jgi:hypothetical protein